jgi:hypothetical protein
MSSKCGTHSLFPFGNNPEFIYIQYPPVCLLLFFYPFTLLLDLPARFIFLLLTRAPCVTLPTPYPFSPPVVFVLQKKSRQNASFICVIFFGSGAHKLN